MWAWTDALGRSCITKISALRKKQVCIHLSEISGYEISISQLWVDLLKSYQCSTEPLLELSDGKDTGYNWLAASGVPGEDLPVPDHAGRELNLAPNSLWSRGAWAEIDCQARIAKKMPLYHAAWIILEANIKYTLDF